MKEKKTIIKKVTLNNKARQGEYIYIKLPNKRGRYFKDIGHDPTYYINYIVNTHNPTKMNFNQMVDKIPTTSGKNRTLTLKAKKGDFKTTKLLSKLNTKSADKLYYELAHKISKNKDKNNVSEIVKKIKKEPHLFYYKLEVVSDDNKKIVTMDDYSKKTIAKAIQDAKNTFNPLMQFKLYIDYREVDTKIRPYYQNTNWRSDGYIKDVKITIGVKQ